MDAAASSRECRSATHPEGLHRRVLVVGSSPISLLIALTASREGYDVTLAERSDRLGGAWAYDEVEGRLIDRACHLLEPLAPARQWLFDQLGEAPSTYEHPPTAVTPWNSVWPISSRRYRSLELAIALPAAARHLTAALGDDRREFARVVAESKHDLGRLTRRTLRELRSGPSMAMTFSPQPFARLCSLVTESAAEVRLSQNVTSVSRPANSRSFHATLNGVPEQFGHVVLPSGADIEISVAGRPLRRRQFHYENHHLLFEATKGGRNLSYVALMADQKVRRVTDAGPAVTSGTTSKPNSSGTESRHLYLAHVRGNEVSAHDAAQVLARHGYIEAAAPVRLVRHYRFTSTRTTFLAAAPPGVWTPDTYGDLTDNLARLLVRDPGGKVRLQLPFAPHPKLREVG